MCLCRDNLFVIPKIRVDYKKQYADHTLGFLLEWKDVRQENEVVFVCYA